MSVLTNVLTPSKRKALYSTYSSIGLALGAVQAGVGAVGATTPDWMKASLAVYAFLGTAIGATAASNVQTANPGRRRRRKPAADA